MKEDAIEYARDLARSWFAPTERPMAQQGAGRAEASDEGGRIVTRASAALAAGATRKPALSRA